MSAAPAHRTTPRRAPAPRGPRRVSGPARPNQRDQRLRANAGAVALPRPVRGGAVTAPAPAFAPRAADALKRLPDHPLLTRLLRGRAWIALIGVALGGIVAMQVSLLKLDSGIARAVETSSTLERQNADLRATVSQLSSEERIQREAAAMGLEMPAAGDVRYLTARGAEDARRAASVMRKPNAPQTATAAVAAGVATQADPATAQAPVEPAAPEAVTPAATTAPAQPEQAAAPVAQTPAPAPAGPPTAPAQPQAAATGAATAPVAGGAE